MEGRSTTPNALVEKSPALSRAGSSTSLRSRASKRQHGGCSSLNGSQGNLTATELMCPVCFELLEEAHITRCGHTFCYRCIAKSLESSGRCPKCSFVVGGIDQVFPNFLLNDLVAKHKVSVAAAQASASVGADETALKEFVTTESHRMTLPDVNAVLELLNHRKQLLEAETCAAQNRLLNEFLRNLLQQKEEQLVRLSKEVSLIKKDIGEVETILRDVEEQAGKLPRMDSEEESDNPQLPKLECPTLTARRRRMHAHFDDFVQCYFTSRAKELVFGDDDTNSNTKGSGLDLFRENLVKFSRYNALKPIASLNYSTGLYNNSTIVSSIEFDKDDELFAIAGVTKRIKVFDYGSVIRDVVDLHYPCVEMVSTSKISCVSWNAYHKSTLASSDYEGTVTVWDACTGQKTKTFQEHEKRCWSVDFNHVDTRLIASGSDDAKVKLWSLNVEHSISSLEAKANVCCVKFNPRSSCHLAFGSADHCVHYYDLRSTKEPLALFKGHRKAVSYVKFLSNEEIVSASTDSQLKMWSITKPHCLRSFTGHINEKNFVGLATDGDYVACGSENNALFVYYKGLSKQLFSFRFDASHGILDKERKEEDAGEFVSAVCWKRMSNVVVAANSQGIIKILELV
ncbi:E3 ubiquitin-protein ligase COP1-like isoform X1 [Neocloeon triangulifer]|uniref:E3 ubiquitin-protein ligase COP1-like isoform X1 n=1 Tax=Neocloeon triangulifer TaxID=2078957 RepID=UPI00286EDCAC|nr:E3 ubiquitin-protein ligase COP1-like isoform X1 [Neocloeon triangulifer]XP_059482752.1 E3 ubiquitin-protein ligase COP1-like isoform X1 [Neocloeon triangulifer]